MKINYKQKNRGFSLVETLVAIAIFSASIIGLMSVLASGIADTNYARQKITATYLAQEGIEYIRNMRDTNALAGGAWNNFTTSLNSCVNKDSACGINNSVPTTDSRFIFSCSTGDCKLYTNSGGFDTNSATGIDSGFTRKIWKETVNGDEVKIFSQVSWTQGSGLKDITLSEDLFNWIE